MHIYRTDRLNLSLGCLVKYIISNHIIKSNKITYLTGEPGDVLFIQSEPYRKDDAYEYIQRIHDHTYYGTCDN